MLVRTDCRVRHENWFMHSFKRKCSKDWTIYPYEKVKISRIFLPSTTVRGKIRGWWSVYPFSVVFLSGPIYVGEGAWRKGWALGSVFPSFVPVPPVHAILPPSQSELGARPKNMVGWSVTAVVVIMPFE
jgi:hypothetical protein